MLISIIQRIMPLEFEKYGSLKEVQLVGTESSIIGRLFRYIFRS